MHTYISDCSKTNWREGKLFLFERPRLYLKIFLLIYMNKDQILTWLAVESEIKSQIIWYKPSWRPGCVDPLLRMHIRCRRNAGWTLIFVIQSNEGGDILVWHLTPAGGMPKEGPYPREKGRHQRREAKEKKKGFCLLTPLSLFSLLSIWFVYYLLCIHR